MLNALLDGISDALNVSFPGQMVSIEPSVQGAVPPCFVVNSQLTTETPNQGDRYWREHSFVIRYYPAEQTAPTREAAAVGSVLFTVLEYIKVNGALVRGSNMRQQIIDGVLQFKVDYNLFVRKLAEPVPYMQTIEQKQRLRGD